MWNQVYDPFDNAVLSTLAAALPVVTLLVLIASGKVKAHIAAIIALIVAILVAILLFTMPAGLALRASVLGAVIGFFPIGWIVLNVIFLYRLTVATGAFATLSQAIGGVTRDRRLQLPLIALSFGAFFEGAAGFGTPVAVTGAILIGLGFSPLAASTRRSASLSPAPACSIRFSAPCSAGSASRRPDPIPLRTCCSAACKKSPRNSLGCRRSSWARPIPRAA
jgi:lactate permease